jgi:hypothetical protein
MEWNSTKKQRWNTKTQKSGSGIRKTLALWNYPEWEIKASYRAETPAAIEALAGFCASVKGSFSPFLWLDPEDYQETLVQIGIGTGSSQQLQLLRNFNSVFSEPVRDIVTGTLHVFADTTEISYTLGTDGLVTVTAGAGKAVKATFQYYWRVAFKDDEQEWEYFWHNLYRVKAIEMVTVR